MLVKAPLQLPVAVLSTSLTQQHKEAGDEDDDHVQLHPAGAAGQGRRPPLSETGDLHLHTIHNSDPILSQVQLH